MSYETIKYIWQILTDHRDGWTDGAQYDTHDEAVRNAPQDKVIVKFRLIERTDTVISDPRLSITDPKPHRDVFDAWWEKRGTITELPPSPIGDFNAAIADFNALCGVEIGRVTASERVDSSMARVMTGMVRGVTKVLEENHLGGRRTGQGTVDH